jgi:hypothetical protein
MNAKRLKLVLLVSLGVLAVVFVVIFVFGISMLNKKSQKMVELKLESQKVENQLNGLAQAKKEIEQYGYFKNIANSVIPNDKDQAQAVVDIYNVAKESGIKIQTISFPSSNLGEAAKPAAPAAGTTSNTVPPATSAVGASPSEAISQAKPVANIKGLYSLELTIAPEIGTQLGKSEQVTYPKLLDFLQRIERNRRTAQITSIAIDPQTPGTVISDAVKFTLVINIFLKP